jgi:hypothetical protein
MEYLIKKKMGKAIPNELIYDIKIDLNEIKNSKRNEKNKKELLNNMIDELNEIESIADDAYKQTKSETKRIKINLFKEYNKDRLKLVKEYINTGNINDYSFTICPITKEFLDGKCKKKCSVHKIRVNGRCVKPKVPKECPEGKIINPKTGRCIKAPKTPKAPKQYLIDEDVYIKYLKDEYNKSSLSPSKRKFLMDIIDVLPKIYSDNIYLDNINDVSPPIGHKTKPKRELY